MADAERHLHGVRGQSLELLRLVERTRDGRPVRANAAVSLADDRARLARPGSAPSLALPSCRRGPEPGADPAGGASSRPSGSGASPSRSLTKASRRRLNCRRSQQSRQSARCFSSASSGLPLPGRGPGRRRTGAPPLRTSCGRSWRPHLDQAAPARAVPQLALERLAPPMQPRHHGPHRAAEHLGQLAIASSPRHRAGREASGRRGARRGGRGGPPRPETAPRKSSWRRSEYGSGSSSAIRS